MLWKKSLLNSNYLLLDFARKIHKIYNCKMSKNKKTLATNPSSKCHTRQVSKIQREKIQLIHSMSIVESFILGIDILLLFSFHSIPASSHLINDLALMEFTFQHTAVSSIVDNDLILIFMSYAIQQINSSINYCPIVQNIHI